MGKKTVGVIITMMMVLGGLQRAYADEPIIDLVAQGTKTKAGEISSYMVIFTKPGEESNTVIGSHYTIQLHAHTNKDHKLIAGLDLNGAFIPCVNLDSNKSNLATDPYQFENIWSCVVPVYFTDYKTVPTDTLTFKVASSTSAVIAASPIALSNATVVNKIVNAFVNLPIWILNSGKFSNKTCPDGTSTPENFLCYCSDTTIYNDKSNSCDTFVEPAPTKTLGVPIPATTPTVPCTGLVDTYGNCLASTTTPSCQPPTDVVQLDKSCGSGCSANETETNKKCVCNDGFVADPYGKICVPKDNYGDPSVSQTPSYGGGGCSLIRNSKDTIPNSANGKNFDLKTMDGSTNGQLQNVIVKYAGGRYTLTGTHPLGASKQSTELVAMEMPSMKILVPVNKEGNIPKCTTKLTSTKTAETVTCLYDVVVNSISDATQPTLFLVQADGSSLMTSEPLIFKDYAPTLALTCTPPQQLSDDKKSCVTPPDQPQKPATKDSPCASYQVLNKNGICTSNPDLGLPAATPYGGKACSLVADASPSAVAFAIFLMPIPMLIARRFVQKLVRR